MEQYVSWGLPREDLSLDTIWDYFEEFCKSQANEVRAHFDLLTSFRQSTRSVDEWHNAVQAQINFTRYPPETAKILHRDIFWFFLKDEDFVSKTINEGSMDLDMFPTSRVHQWAKKIESSKATTRPIKQVAGGPPGGPDQSNASSVHLITKWQVQREKKTQVKQKQAHQKNGEQRPPNQYKKRDLILDWLTKTRIDVASVEIPFILKGSSAQPKKQQCKACHKFGHCTSLCFQKAQHKQSNYKHRKPTAHQLKAATIHLHDSNEEADSLDDSFCLQLKIHCAEVHHKKTQKLACLITNLAYRLKQHENRNLYLRARLCYYLATQHLILTS